MYYLRRFQVTNDPTVPNTKHLNSCLDLTPFNLHSCPQTQQTLPSQPRQVYTNPWNHQNGLCHLQQFQENWYREPNSHIGPSCYGLYAPRYENSVYNTLGLELGGVRQAQAIVQRLSDAQGPEPQVITVGPPP